jgi:hypothetical protein
VRQTTIATIAAKEIALSLCKGSYQTSLVHGAASWSGSIIFPRLPIAETTMRSPAPLQASIRL